MPLDHSTLQYLRRHHPAWRFLCAQHAPFAAAFLHRVFIAGNARNLPQAELVEALEDELFALREREGEAAYPGAALDYLDDWAGDDKGWLRKFYPPGSDEPHFDLTPPTEKAIVWLAGLTGRDFVGTESRLQTLLDLLRQIRTGSQTDPRLRIAELEKRRAALDVEIERIRAGELPLIDDTGIRERFLQFQQMARELLADFREVEANFRKLDRQARERITLWAGAKGQLLDDILDARDDIANSDQGRSFRAFWDFLMSSSRQEELDMLLEEVLALPAVVALRPDPRLRRVHHAWLVAGEYTQRTVARLSEQLRRFLDDRVWLENRRIMDILQRIETHALALRDTPPPGECMGLDDMAPSLDLPLEHPLYRPPLKPAITTQVPDAGDAELDARIRRDVGQRGQVTLAGVIERHPLRHGLAELVAYFQVACAWPDAVVDESATETVRWRTGAGGERRATLPRVILAGG